jgi:hypothetical protein
LIDRLATTRLGASASSLLRRLSIITFLLGLLRIDAQFADANAPGTGPRPGGWAMTDQEDRIAREREEIVARVASFRATQQKFERDRQEYYDNTLGNAWSGFQRKTA